MILYDYFRSSAAYRVRIALNLKGVAYEHRSVNLLNGEENKPPYTDLNPQALVPTLVTESEDGREVCLTQSLAICEYLDECYKEPPLLPQDRVQRATIKAFAQAIACDIHPLNNLRVLNYLTGEMQHSEAEKLNWYHHWIELGFTALESQVESRVAGKPLDKYCFGNTPSLADVCLEPQIFNAERFEVPLQNYPNLLRIHDNCQALSAFANAHPAKQPDSPSQT